MQLRTKAIAIANFSFFSMLRPLSKQETEILFKKLTNYLGENLTLLINRKDTPHHFRLQNNRVYYISEEILKTINSLAKDNLISMGTYVGKFTKTLKFMLKITCLDLLSKYSKYKVWVKQQGEMNYLYGNHMLKAHLGRITEDCPSNTGVVVYNMNDIPLGFGVTSKSTAEMRKMEPTQVCLFHQTDVGEYLRDEEIM